MLEILRRVALLVGVYGAVVVLLYTRPGVIEIARWDFAARKAAAPRWKQDPAQPLADYIAEETQGRRAELSGAAWVALADGLRATGAPGEVWRLPGDTLFEELRPGVDRDKRFVFVRVPAPGGATWLGVTWRAGHEARGAPADLVRPLRPTWPWWALGGVLLYALLPRRRREADTIGYALLPARLMPDVLGLLLGGAFFTLGLVVPRAIADDGRMLVPEFWVLYLVFGLFVLLSWAIHAASARYAAYRLRITPEVLEQRTLFSQRTIRLADIVSAEAVPRQAPRWLRRAMWIAGLFNPRALGQAMILSSRSDPELLIRETDGRETRILLTALEGQARLRTALAGFLVPGPG